MLLLFSIILTAVSLFSYDASDPCIGPDFFTIPEVVLNLFGLVGAHVAGFFIYLFGVGALWVPLILSLTGLWYFKERSSNIIWMTLAGGLVLMISTGSILFLFKESYGFSNTLISAGGVVGNVLASFLLKYTNIIGCITDRKSVV